jgi:hypothetical protein
VGLFIGAVLIANFTRESNLYCKQNSEKWKPSVKMLRRSDITEVEMEKFQDWLFSDNTKQTEQPGRLFRIDFV